MIRQARGEGYDKEDKRRRGVRRGEGQDEERDKMIRHKEGDKTSRGVCKMRGTR